MKANSLFILTAFFAAVTFSACNKDNDPLPDNEPLIDNSKPVPSQNIYVIARIDGEKWFSSQTSSPGYEQWNNNYFASVWGGYEGDNANIGIQFYLTGDQYYVTDSMVMSLTGKTLLFDSTNANSGHIELKIDGEILTTDNAKTQNGSMYISKIDTIHAELAISFFITGIFSCTLDNKSNTNAKDLTEGEFCFFISSFFF